MIRLAVDALNLRADARGMGRFVRTVLRGLGDDIDVTLIVRDRRDERALGAELAGVRFERPKALRRRDAFDAVWYPWNGVRFPAAAPSLLTVHDDFAFRYPARGAFARRREQAPIRRGVRTATQLSTVSHWSRRALAERFALDPARIAVIPQAPDPRFFPADEPSPVERRFALVVGAGDPRKNLLSFADMFAGAFTPSELRLVVVGAPSREEQRRLRARDLDAVTLTPDDALLRALYRNARVVAVPSRSEGFGLVPAEAQASGAAVVTSSGGALAETAGDAALLVDPDDRAGWVVALRAAVYDDALNARLRRAGAARWDAVSRDVSAVAVRDLLARLVDERA